MLFLLCNFAGSFLEFSLLGVVDVACLRCLGERLAMAVVVTWKDDETILRDTLVQYKVGVL